MSNTTIPAEQAVERLANERPDWIPALDAALAVVDRIDGEEFAGAWVFDELERRGGRRIPNLRVLAGYGLIEKSGPSTRGGRRAYYRFVDRTGVEQALRSRRGRRAAERPRRFRFVAAGAASNPPGDTARRAGEIAFEPRSWR